MVNRDFDPSDSEASVMDLLTAERGTGDPWGRVTPRYVADQTAMTRSTAQYALGQLEAAGWVTKRAKGLYEFVEDPRDSTDYGGKNEN